MTTKERLSLTLGHREADRVPIMDTIWDTAVSRWRQEGLPSGQSVGQYFGFDGWTALGGDISLQLPPETIEETPAYTVTRDSNGAVTRRWKHSMSTPELVSFLITCRKDWERYKDHTRYNSRRVKTGDAVAAFRKAAVEGRPVQYFNGAGYDWWQRIVGPVTMLTAMADDPDWVREMLEANTALNITIMEELIGQGIEFDSAFFWDDLGYRNGTLFSPAMYRELVFPYHRRLCDFCNGRKMAVVLHSCGKVDALIPMFIEAGFACLQPLEVKSGMDLFDLKKRYGAAITLMGGIDVRKMALGGSALEQEVVEKIRFARTGGGYIYHSDHSVPDNVSFANYARVISLVRDHGAY